MVPPLRKRSDARDLRGSSRGGGLLEDLRRQQRRRTLRRAAMMTGLGVALLSAGLGFKVLADRRNLNVAMDTAVLKVDSGTLADLETAARLLESEQDDDSTISAAVALLRAHEFAEFGVQGEAAKTAVAQAPSGAARTVAEALLALGEGRVDDARAGLPEPRSAEAPGPGSLLEGWVAQEIAWLGAMVAVARLGEDPARLEEALSGLDRQIRAFPRAVSLKRARARLLIAMGRSEDGLQELERARDLSRSHLGLAADEAIYNAALHRELGGVASVAEQLIAMELQGVAPPDLAHARLARAVAHVWSGEAEDAAALLSAAWVGLPTWERNYRQLAIQTALEAGEGAMPLAWLPESGLPATEQAIYSAWGILLEGNVMLALETLEDLSQEHPWVGYLQALALVEQRRFEEAQPWIERVDVMLPGRVEVEVARARIDVQLGDPQRALRRLRALAEEEPYAPRAYTGLGEAYLQQTGQARDWVAAKRALTKAIEREPVPAEAMLLLARVWHEKRTGDPLAERKALDLLEDAAKTNPHLPRYRIELALYRAELGYDHAALTLLRELASERALTWAVPLALVRLELDASAGAFDASPYLTQAATLGADARTLERERARGLLLQATKASLAQAESKLLALLQGDETDVDTRVLYALTRARQNDRKSAKSIVMRGFSVSPEAQHGRLHYALAEIQARFGQRDRAAPRARRAWIQMREEQRPATELLDVAELTTSLWTREGEDRVALAVARELTSRMSYHHEAWTIRARTELAAGESGAARTSSERAIELEPNHAEAHFIRAHCLIRFGHKEQAKAAYARAIELARGTPLEEDAREQLERL